MINPEKAFHAAGFLLWKAGGELDAGRVSRLLYQAERASLLTNGMPLTGDRLMAFPEGPGLETMSRWLEGRDSSLEDALLRRDGAVISLRNKAAPDRDGTESVFDLLSEAETEILERVLKAPESRLPPEWRKPARQPEPISVTRLFLTNGRTEAEAAAAESQLKEMSDLDTLLRRYTV